MEFYMREWKESAFGPGNQTLRAGNMKDNR